VCDKALSVAQATKHMNPMEKKQCQLQSERRLSTKTRSMLDEPIAAVPRTGDSSDLSWFISG